MSHRVQPVKHPLSHWGTTEVGNLMHALRDKTGISLDLLRHVNLQVHWHLRDNIEDEIMEWQVENLRREGRIK